MQITATPGLDSSLPTDDEELMEISETAEGLVTKEYVADSSKVCVLLSYSRTSYRPEASLLSSGLGYLKLIDGI